MRFGIFDHAIDFVVVQRGRAGNRDLLLLAGAEILCRHVHDAVGVDVERDLDLRNAAARSRNAGELELAKRLVAGSHLALALEDVHLDGGLVVCRSRIDLGLASRDRGVALDHLGHNAAHGLNAKRQRGHVEQQDAFDVAGKHAALNSCAHGDNLVGVHRHVRIFAGHLLDEFLHGGHTGGAADEDDLVDVPCLEISVFQRLLDGLLAAIEQIFGDALELRAGKRVIEMLRTRGVCRDEGQVDVGLRGGRKLHLRLLGSFLQTLQGHLVLAKVDAVFRFELVGHPVDDALIPVVAAEVIVACGGANFEDAVAQLEHRNVERAAAEVEYQDLLILVRLIETVGKRCSRGFVDDAENLKAGDLASVFGCLALSVVEVRGDGDDRLGDRAAELLFRIVLQLLENHGRNLFGGVILALDVDDGAAVLSLLDFVADGFLLFACFVVGTADKALHGRNGVFRIGDRLVLCRFADDALAVFAEAFDGGGGTIAFGVDQNFGLAAFHYRHRRVSGS